MGDLPWGRFNASEDEGSDRINHSYGNDFDCGTTFGHRFTIGSDGTVFALVSGAMGYEATHITIPREHIIALVEDWPEFNSKEAHHG
jgi:hypothetical protein